MGAYDLWVVIHHDEAKELESLEATCSSLEGAKACVREMADLAGFAVVEDTFDGKPRVLACDKEIYEEEGEYGLEEYLYIRQFEHGVFWMKAAKLALERKESQNGTTQGQEEGVAGTQAKGEASAKA